MSPSNDANETIRPIVNLAKLLSQQIVSNVDEFVRNIQQHHKVEEHDMDAQMTPVDPEMMYQMLAASPVFLTELVEGVSELTIIYATPMMEEMFGYCTGELNGAQVSELIPADKREPHNAHILKLAHDPHDRQMGDSANVKPEGVHKITGERFPIVLLWKRIVRRPRTFLVGTVMRQLAPVKTP